MLAMVVSLGVYAKSDKDTTVSFRIKPALSCSNCESKVKSNLRFEKGVTTIETVVPGDIVTVTFDGEKTNVDNISQALTKLGYEVVLCKDSEVKCAATPCTTPSKTCEGTESDCCNGASHHHKK